MKASKAQITIIKQQKVILNILLYMLKEGVTLSEEEIQNVMRGDTISLDTSPIAPAKKSKMSAQEVAEKQANDIAHIESLAKKAKKEQKPKQKVKKSEQDDESLNQDGEEALTVPLQEDDTGWGDDGEDNVNPLPTV